jgi:hypothetical protein
MKGTEGIGGSTSAYYASRTKQAQATGTSSDCDQASAPAGDGAAGGGGISDYGKLVSALQQLQTQDPAKFKEVVTDIAGQLQSAADQQGSSTPDNGLSKLTDKFRQVADTGDVSKLQGRHHHHHGGGGGTYGNGGKPAETAGPPPGAGQIRELFSQFTDEVNAALGAGGAESGGTS